MREPEPTQTANDALRLTEETLRLALAATGQGLYDLDLRTGIVTVTPQYMELFGEDPSLATFDFSAFADRLHSDDRDRVLERVAAMTRGDMEDYRDEFRLRHSSGRWVWVLSIGRVVEHDSEGQALRILGSHTDVTARKAAEDALGLQVHESRRLAESGISLLRCRTSDDVFGVIRDYVAATVPGVVGIVSRCAEDSSHLVVMSVIGLDDSMLARAAAIVGFEIVGKKAVITQADRDRVYDRALERIPGGLAALAAGEMDPTVARTAEKVFGFRDAYTIGITDGDTTFGNISLLTREEGRTLPVHAIESFVHQAFLTLARIGTERRLAKSEERFRDMFEQAPMGIALVDSPTGHIFEVNPEFASIVGRTQEEMASTDWMSITHPDDMQADLENQARLNAGEIPGFRMDKRYLRPDGSVVWVNMTIAPLRGEDPAHPRQLCMIEDITERKREQDALEESEAWLQQAQRVARIGHYVFDIGSDAWTSSASLDDIFGIDDAYPHDVGSWAGIIHPDQRAEMLAYLSEAVVRDHHVFDREYRIVRVSDRAERWVHGLGNLLIDADGVATRMFGTIQDITDRVATEEALRSSEDQFKYIFDHSPVGMSMTFADGEIHANDALAAMLGYTHEELEGRRAQDVTHPDDIRMTERTMGALIAGETEVVRIEKRFVRKDGSTAWAYVSSNLRRDPEGRPLYFVTTVVDITARKAMEEELHKASTLLEQMFEQSPIPMVLVSMPDAVLRLVNPACVEFLGIADEPSPIGTPLADFVPSYQDFDRQGNKGTLPQLPLARALRGECTFNEERRIVRKDGTTRWHLVSAGPIRDVYGEMLAAYMVLVDITDRKRIEAELDAHRSHLQAIVKERTADLAATNESLEATNEELREATTAKSAFLASMSHELRTPLNSIIGFSGVLGQGLAGSLTIEQKTQIGMVNRSGRHLLSLINDVLDLAKVEAGRSEVAIERVEPGALAREVVEAVRPLAEEKGLALELEVGRCSVPLETDVGKLRQILFNLVGNAVKFTGSGRVHVLVECPLKHCTFAVTDTGPGIAAADLPRVFDAFIQLDIPGVAKPLGTGLGLRISQQYAWLLGGELSVISEVGTGSTFTLTLPAAPANLG